MFVELGFFALILSMLFSLIQSIVPLFGVRYNYSKWMFSADLTAISQLILISFAFVILIRGFILSDFSIELVAANSHTLKPLMYKITGVWANHEGSMFLWIWILCLFGALVAIFGKNLPLNFRSTVLSIQAIISFFFYNFLIFTSNPFSRLETPPFDGNGLNPVLQDPGLAFHPPFLYVGYVGLSITFSFALAGLILGKIDRYWATWIKPWTLLSWIFLTIGIGWGSWWAYYELGWGGWWAWDPVENVSFMPWLLCTALLHSVTVSEKRNTLKGWTMFLALSSFSFSLIGTFIVRSGILTSVHAFANDPTRGLYLLVIILIIIITAFIIFLYRYNKFSSDLYFSFFSKETGLIFNNLLLTSTVFVIFVGTLWPIIFETFTNDKVSVGAPFFDIVTTPFFLFLAFILPFGSSLSWREGKIKKNLSHLPLTILITIIVCSFTWYYQENNDFTAPLGILFSFWVIFGSIMEFLKKSKINFNFSKNHLNFFNSIELSKFISHVGFGLLIFGISAVISWEREDIRTINIGEEFTLSKYKFQLDSIETKFINNYKADIAKIKVFKDEKFIVNIYPQKRIYPVQNTLTTEAGIDSNIFRDIYLVLGDKQDNGSWVLRTYIKPFLLFIYLGIITLSLGGLIGLIRKTTFFKNEKKII